MNNNKDYNKYRIVGAIQLIAGIIVTYFSHTQFSYDQLTSSPKYLMLILYIIRMAGVSSIVLAMINILTYRSKITYAPVPVKPNVSAGITLEDFIATFKDTLPALYIIEYTNHENLKAEKVFCGNYKIAPDAALDIFIEANHYNEGHFIYTKGPLYSIIEHDLINFNSQGEGAYEFESPEERNEFIQKINESMKMINCSYYYSLFGDYDEDTIRHLLEQIEKRPNYIEVSEEEYELRHSIELNKDGTYTYSCNIESLNDILLERFLIKGIDWYVDDSYIGTKPSLQTDEKAKGTVSSKYTFINLAQVYATIEKINRKINTFIKKETMTVKNYVKEQVSREVTSVDNHMPQKETKNKLS